MKYSAKLLSKKREFKISRRSLAILRGAGVTSISLGGPGYAYAWYRGEVMPIHRILMSALGHNIDGMYIDHKNGNKLDNRLFNLRIATNTQNVANQCLSRRNTSGYKGVALKSPGRWFAYIGRGRDRKYLGHFSSAVEAGSAYNRAARKKYGKFAKLNCIPGRNS